MKLVMDIAIPPLAAPPMRASEACVHDFGGETMATTWSVRLVADPAHDVAPMRRACETVLGTVIAQMSQWEPSSDISRYNAALPGTWHELPDAFAAVLEESLAIAALSGGAFDPTVGPASEAWGFGSRPVSTAPDAASCQAMCGQLGWQRLDFKRESRRLLQPGGLELDFCAIAKGHAVDLVTETLLAQGIEACLVEIGGELRGSGIKADGLPWWVDVETLPNEDIAPLRIALADCAMATSGHSRRFHMAGDRKLGHTMDPARAAPAQTAIESVTVLAATAMRADALATALMVMGDGALDFAREHAIPARLLLQDTQGLRSIYTPALEAMLD